MGFWCDGAKIGEIHTLARQSQGACRGQGFDLPFRYSRTQSA